MTTSIMLSVADIVGANGHKYRAGLRISSLVEMDSETSLGHQRKPQDRWGLDFQESPASLKDEKRPSESEAS